VYIEEVPSGVRTIIGVATSITAFVGRAARGPTNDPTRIANFGDFERKFGGLDVKSSMSYAVQQFFLNGGNEAIIVRVSNGEKAKIDAGGLLLEASGEGVWGNQLRVRIDYDTKEPEKEKYFNITIQDRETRATEEFRNLSVDRDDARYVKPFLEERSIFIRVSETDDDPIPGARPTENETPDPIPDDLFADGQDFAEGDGGNEGGEIDDDVIKGSRNDKEGIYALEKADLFNILCIPPLTRSTGVDVSTLGEAAKYCTERRAMLLVDPALGSAKTVKDGADRIKELREAISDNAKNSAFFFPLLKAPDPKKENRLQEFVPSGAIAGVMARTDLQRGVWKSPAGTEASLVNVRDLTFKMTDPENGQLNPEGVNCLRNFPPVYGNVVWGSRTLAGADRLSSEWKYLAVRRVTLFIEESLYRGTQWAVFEPNDEPLWAQIRLNIGAFMHNLFRQGAFQGRSPREAYFVKCDKSTTTQNDIDRGIVNIEVGFAPLKPAEFVIVKIQQMAGQIET
jgi:phage tail sheath protein FI